MKWRKALKMLHNLIFENQKQCSAVHGLSIPLWPVWQWSVLNDERESSWTTLVSLHPLLQHHTLMERRGCCHKNIQCVIGSTFRSHMLCVQTHVDLNEPNYNLSQGSCISLWSTFSTWILTIALNADPNQSISTIHSDIILFWTKLYAVWSLIFFS